MPGEMFIVRQELHTAAEELRDAGQLFGQALEHYSGYQEHVEAALGTLATSRETTVQVSGMIVDLSASGVPRREISARIDPELNSIRSAYHLTLKAQTDQALVTLGNSLRATKQARNELIAPACGRIQTVLAGETAGDSGETLQHANRLAAHAVDPQVVHLWEQSTPSLHPPQPDQSRANKIQRVRQIRSILAEEQKRLRGWLAANDEYKQYLEVGVRLIGQSATSAADYAARL
jgi:hypothetical protein